MGCPFKIKFAVSKDGHYLEITEFYANHEGHELSEKLYEHLPQVKKLNKEDTEEIEKCLEVDSNSTLIQNIVMLENGKTVTLKDINNIKWKLKEDSNDLRATIKFLKEDYKANIGVLRDSDNNLKAMYFFTEDMSTTLAAFPEIVFLDGTHKLLNKDLTLMLMIVEDSNGLYDVVRVCLLCDEDEETFKWFLTKFIEENKEVSSSIQCFVTDKDLLQRDTLKETFVGVPVYICLFNTLKTFRRTFTTDKFRIKKKEREICFELLTKLAYSNSEESYNEFYEIFSNTCPLNVVAYFNENWHTIRSEWTCYSMTHGNLKNRTNNRLVSLNQKIKTLVALNKSLCSFTKSFLDFLQSHNEKRKNKVAQIILKRPVRRFAENSCEKKYLDLLTPYAFSYVQSQCELSKTVCLIEDDEGFKVNIHDRIIAVDAGTCECTDFSSMMLPCKHVLCVRRYLDLSLYCEEACNKRWHKNFYLKRHGKNIPEVQKPMVLSQAEKREQTNFITHNLVDLACRSTNSQFQYRIDCLKRVEALWRRGCEVKITKTGRHENSVGDDTDSVLDSENIKHTSVGNRFFEEVFIESEVPVADTSYLIEDEFHNELHESIILKIENTSEDEEVGSENEILMLEENIDD